MDDLSLLKSINQALEDIKAIDIKNIEVTDVSPCFDHVVIASGSSKAHLKGICDKLTSAIPKKPAAIEGRQELNWLLLDYGNIIVHLFLDELRPNYSLEELYQVWISEAATEKNH